MIFYGSSGYDVGIEPSEKRKEFNVQCTGLFGFREAGSRSCHVTANQRKFLTFQLPSGALTASAATFLLLSDAS